MAKKKRSNVPPEESLLLPTPPSTSPIIDTHTHIASTFQFYQRFYKDGKHDNAFEFIRKIYEGRNVESIVDVWCEAPVLKSWRIFADSALKAEDRETIWGGINYWFVLGELYYFYIEYLTERCRQEFTRMSPFYFVLSVFFTTSNMSSHDAKLYTDEVEKDMFVSARLS
jgi:hypothetical protein